MKKLTVDDDVVGKAYDARLMKRLMAFVVPYKAYIAVSFVALIVFTAIDIFATVHLPKMIIDEYIVNNTVTGLTLIAAMFFVLILVGMFFQFVQFYLVNAMSQRVMFDLRMHLFKHLERQSLSFYNRRPVGYLMTRLTSDIEALDSMFANCIVFTFNDILIIIGLLAYMLYLSPMLTLVTLAVLPLIMLASILFQKAIRASYRDVRKLLSRMNGFLQENISGMETIQIFNRQERNHQQFSRLNEDFKNAHMRSVRSFSLFLPVVEFLGSLAIALLLWFGGRGMLDNPDGITFGMLTAFLFASQKFFQPIRDLADKFNIMQTAMTAAERVFKLLDTNEVIEPPSQPVRRPVTGEVEFRNVWFAYQEENWVLRDVSFKAPIGSRVAIVGATGSGKSTIINLLFRFYDIQRGEILVDGVNIKNYDLRDLRAGLGLVLQDVFLFSGDIESNIGLRRPDITPEAIRNAAKAVQADPFIRRLPGGYNAEVKERGATLSSGQRQLLSFARALAMDPKILILDEATSSVDTETEHLIQEALGRLLEGRTSIIVAHRLSTIQKADEILVLHKGEIKERGNHRELLEREGIYHRLYQLQYKDQPAGDGQPAAPRG